MTAKHLTALSHRAKYQPSRRWLVGQLQPKPRLARPTFHVRQTRDSPLRRSTVQGRNIPSTSHFPCAEPAQHSPLLQYPLRSHFCLFTSLLHSPFGISIHLPPLHPLSHVAFVLLEHLPTSAILWSSKQLARLSTSLQVAQAGPSSP